MRLDANTSGVGCGWIVGNPLTIRAERSALGVEAGLARQCGHPGHWRNLPVESRRRGRRKRRWGALNRLPVELCGQLTGKLLPWKLLPWKLLPRKQLAG